MSTTFNANQLYTLYLTLSRYQLERYYFQLIETSGSDSDGDEECVYLCGNSLGLKPKMADAYMTEQLENWGKQ